MQNEHADHASTANIATPRRTHLPSLLRFIKPTLPPLEQVLAYYAPIYRNGVITNGATVERFEHAIAEMLGVRHCVAVSSCTSGLMMVQRALDLTGEVILPSFTFFATGISLLWNGLTPVFADCNPDTWTISVEDAERRITERTSAIVAVHLYGNPCDAEALQNLASRYRLKLIFDAAHAFGSVRRSRPVGGFGDAEVFSLSPTKLLVCGEGGLVTTSDPVLAGRIKASRNYGDLGAYDPELPGLNSRMSEFNAALGLAGLPLVPAKVRRHNEIAEAYTSSLQGCSGVRFQSVDPLDTCTYKDYSILVDPSEFGMSRDHLTADLRSRNIDTKRYFYPPLHRQKLFSAFWRERGNPLPNTEIVAEGVLSLPIYESLPDEIVATITDAVRSCHSAQYASSHSAA